MKEQKFLPKNPCDVIIFVDTIKIVSKFVVTLRTLLESGSAEDESEWAREAHGKNVVLVPYKLTQFLSQLSCISDCNRLSVTFI